MTFAFRNQPWKALYLATSTVTLFLQLPIYAVIYVLPGARPRRSWSIGRSLAIFAFRSLINVLYNISPTLMDGVLPAEGMTPKQLSEAETYGFVWVDGAPEFVTGEIKDTALLNEVTPARTSGYWYGKRDPSDKVGQKASPNERVIYHFHGGGFVSGTAHPSNRPLKTLLEGLMQHIPGEPRVFALEYRISSTTPFVKANPFPAALLDAIAGYRYLIHDVGFVPTNILISGDSAGGQLAFWLAKYLSTTKFSELPAAGGLLMLSPTLDWANTRTGLSSSMKQHKDSDFIDIVLTGGYPRRALLGKIPEAEVSQNEWMAPGSIQLPHKPGSHAGLPKTCIVAGGAEQILDSMVTLTNRLTYDLGSENVTFLEAKDATHDFLLFSWHEPERTETLKEVKNITYGIKADTLCPPPPYQQPPFYTSDSETIEKDMGKSLGHSHAIATHEAAISQSSIDRAVNTFSTRAGNRTRTTWSNLDPQSKLKHNPTGPASILIHMAFINASLSPRGLTRAFCGVTLPGDELRRARRHSKVGEMSLPKVNLPALKELYLRGSFVACGIMLEQLDFPLTCTVTLDITADTYDALMQEGIERTLHQVLARDPTLLSMLDDHSPMNHDRWCKYVMHICKDHEFMFTLGRQHLDFCPAFRPQFVIVYKDPQGYSSLPFNFILAYFD
ncbi:hypothetical protein CVT25_015433 [Psilocybe cyanescens]|uniref:Alpha/beta hydrolase fold-3 domain-containing protein n=1 Tax=Psilocybe cyanescens TaxID=93625 RepID=A0A409WHE0_PSICY|nr:hypothetical protein CVT25_015433 [Psilocybe cyanescens]